MTAELKQIVANRIDALADELIAVSHDIHAHPELAFNEHHASGLLCNALTSAGLAVKRSAYGLETAFETEFDGTGAGPRVALLAEYDALPGIGHACGAQPDRDFRAWAPRSASRRSATASAARCGCWARPPKKRAAAKN